MFTGGDAKSDAHHFARIDMMGVVDNDRQQNSNPPFPSSWT
jgi:hypothetical protein